MCRSPSALAAAAVCVLVFTGCNDREVTSYRVPRETVTVAAIPGSTPNTNDLPATPRNPGPSVETPESGGLAWSAPAHWQAKPSQPMRRGSFNVPGAQGADADLSIIAFPGSAGGLLDNLNRWRGQINLLPIAAEALPEHTERLPVGTIEFTLVDFSGSTGGATPEPQRILGAVATVGDETWFFKLMGPDATVAREKSTFVNFLNTVRLR